MKQFYDTHTNKFLHDGITPHGSHLILKDGEVWRETSEEPSKRYVLKELKPLMVIMVTYKRHDMFRKTVDSLIPTMPAGSTLVIVDNEQYEYGDEHRAWTEAITNPTVPSAVKIRALLLPENKGWGYAMNRGLDWAPDWRDHEYVLESNNDVTYETDWFEESKIIMDTWPEIGLLGLWSHPHHGLRGMMQRGVLRVNVKDNMPATAWLFRSKDLAGLLPFKERGACNTRGGNGEDTDMVFKVQNFGMWVACPIEDLAHHMDGYDIPDLGKPNPAYE